MTHRHTIAGLLALALLPAAAGCGSDSGSAPASGASGKTAQAPSAPTLDSEEQRALERVRKDFSAYCDTKRNEPVGSAAIAESLLDFGAGVRTASGSALGDELAKSRDELRSCGADKLAKRLSAALKAAKS
jgi:hypothetical protein